MSWDIYIQDLPAGARTVDDIPDDFVPAPIGRRSFIIGRIKEVAPAADFTDPQAERLNSELPSDGPLAPTPIQTAHRVGVLDDIIYFVAMLPGGKPGFGIGSIWTRCTGWLARASWCLSM